MKGIQFKRSPFVRACLVKCIGHLTAVGIGFIPFLVAPSGALADVSVTLKLDRTEVNKQSSFSLLTEHRRGNVHMAAHVISFSIRIADERV